MTPDIAPWAAIMIGPALVTVAAVLLRLPSKPGRRR